MTPTVLNMTKQKKLIAQFVNRLSIQKPLIKLKLYVPLHTAIAMGLYIDLEVSIRLAV